MDVKIITDTDDLTDAMYVRKLVFTLEQGFSAPDSDQYDAVCTHVVLYDAGKPIATGRIYKENGIYHPGRIAVIKEYRGKQLGKVVMQELERTVSPQNGCTFSLSAQLHAIPFYERLGYKSTGERHMDEHCMHEILVKRISLPD